MNRSDALSLLQSKVSNQNLIKHSFAVEAIMRALARHFDEDVELWGLAGLLHDIDYDITKEDPTTHSKLGAEMLADLDLDPRIVYAVRAHNDYHGDPRHSLLDRSLFCCDPLTGLITAGALIRPEKRLAPLTPEFILKRFGEKGFARGANRETIRMCSDIGMSLDEFVALGLEAMQGISADLGL
jgi:putative nucleotidyltransferase with HDIG domain